MLKCSYYKSATLAVILCVCYVVKSQDTVPSDISANSVTVEIIENKLDSAKKISNADIKGAISLAQSALEDATLIESDLMIAESKLAIGRFYDYLGVNAEATNHLADALQIFTKLGLKEKTIRASKLIGNIYWYLGETDLALKYFNDQIEYAIEVKDTVMLINGLNSSGSVYGMLHKYDTAYYIFEKAYNLALLGGDDLSKVHSLLYLGYAKYSLGEPAKALELFKKIENEYNVESISSMLLSNLYQQFTYTYIKLGDIPNATKYSNKEYEALQKYPRINQWEQHYLVQFRLDSVNNDLLSAIKHYQLYKMYYDSTQTSKFRDQMANYEVIRQLEEKEVQIDQLKLDNELKDLSLSHRRTVIFGSYLVIFLLIVVIVLSLRMRIRQKRRNAELALANEQISEQRKQLADKNSALEQAIEELKATQQHLVHSEKMASLGVLTAGIAHEINNPLNYINGGVEIIADHLKATDEKFSEETQTIFDESMHIITEGVDRTANIVKSLMTFSYRGKAKLVPYSLTKLIDNTLVFMHSKLTGDINIIKDYTYDGESLLYPDKLHQVLLNIIDNAIFAVNESGKDNKEIIITTAMKNKKILIHIQDNGPGISEESLPCLFDPFYTTKNPGEGTGLGLSISYNLIQEQSGFLGVENTHPGCRFTIKLPYKK